MIINVEKTKIDELAIEQCVQILVDNGIEIDEADSVLQAIGYALIDTELYPEDEEPVNKVYSEVRIEYFDENKCCWTIDTWKTNDPSEEGVVVGEIYEDERGVVYLDEEAENNPQVQEAVKDFYEFVGYLKKNEE